MESIFDIVATSVVVFFPMCWMPWQVDRTWSCQHEELKHGTKAGKFLQHQYLSAGLGKGLVLELLTIERVVLRDLSNDWLGDVKKWTYQALKWYYHQTIPPNN